MGDNGIVVRFFQRPGNIHRLNNMVSGSSFKIIQDRQKEGNVDENTLPVRWSLLSCS